MKKLLLVPALALAGIGIAHAATHATSVKATEVEFHIKLSAASAKAGKTTFTVKNAGHLAHQFLVLKTTLAAGKLPLKGTTVNLVGGQVAEEHVVAGGQGQGDRLRRARLQAGAADPADR